MKILKPGKVEMRKFVCPQCGCIFVADSTEAKYRLGRFYVDCPCCKAMDKIWWSDGGPYEEPYEEPAPTQTGDEITKKLCRIISESPVHFPQLVSASAMLRFVDYLTDSGVTFREE